jgi:hypothetical protein
MLQLSPSTFSERGFRSFEMLRSADWYLIGLLGNIKTKSPLMWNPAWGMDICRL